VSPTATASYLRAAFQPEWAPAAGDPGRRGFLTPDPRVQTLLRVLVSYPEVRFILPDRVGLDASADARLVDTLMRFLGRQSWLVTSVTVGG
jgi:hypothetical protein